MHALKLYDTLQECVSNNLSTYIFTKGIENVINTFIGVSHTKLALFIENNEFRIYDEKSYISKYIEINENEKREDNKLSDLWNMDIKHVIVKFIKHDDIIGVLLMPDIESEKYDKLKDIEDVLYEILKLFRYLKIEEQEKIYIVNNLKGTVNTSLKMTMSQITKQKTVDSLKHNLMELCDVFNNLVDYSKLITNDNIIVNKPMNLESSLTFVASMIYGFIDEKDLTFDTRFEKNFPEIIISDHVRIKQILINVLKNSVDHTECKLIKLTVKKDPNKDVIIFEVLDNGKGIPNCVLNYINDPYLSKDKIPGDLGLGLCITKKIVNLMDGEMKIESKHDVPTHTKTTIRMKYKVPDLNISQNVLIKFFANKKVLVYCESNKKNDFFSLLAKYEILPTFAEKDSEFDFYLKYKFDIIIFDSKLIKNINLNWLSGFKIMFYESEETQKSFNLYDYKLDELCDSSVEKMLTYIYNSN